MASQDMVKQFLESRIPETVLKTLGMRVEWHPEHQVVVVAEVDSRLYQPTGVVHGGVYVLMAETAASIAATLLVDISKQLPLGMEINANHLRPCSEGTIRAIPRLLHRGKTSMVFGTEIRDEKDRVLSVGRCTMALKAVAGE
jgi:uncharacterized protein (TIGR00369 family)